MNVHGVHKTEVTHWQGDYPGIDEPVWILESNEWVNIVSMSALKKECLIEYNSTDDHEIVATRLRDGTQ